MDFMAPKDKAAPKCELNQRKILKYRNKIVVSPTHKHKISIITKRSVSLGFEMEEGINDRQANDWIAGWIYGRMDIIDGEPRAACRYVSNIKRVP
jgi:hypothetical protein